MNAFRGLKGKLVGAHERIGKGVELVREVVGVFISETDGTTSGHGRDNEARRLAVVPADSCSEDSGHAAAKTQFRDEWQTYIKVATAETRQGEDARLKQLDVVLQKFRAPLPVFQRARDRHTRVRPEAANPLCRALMQRETVSLPVELCPVELERLG